MVAAPSAGADTPTDPASSSEAKQAWDRAQRDAEIAAEQLNGARADQAKADKVASKAAADVVTADRRLDGARKHAADTAAEVTSYQTRLDAFASASFRGGRLGDMSAVFTATSADDYLDQATVINQVAGDVQQTLNLAKQAKDAAATAQTAAVSAESAATQAKSAADQAKADAAQATQAAVDKKKQLDASVAKYKDLYNKLSAKERAEAEAAAAKAKAESDAAAQRLLDQQAAAAAAASSSSQSQQQAAALDAGTSSSSQSSSSSQTSSSSSSTPSSTSSNSGTTVSGGDSLGQEAARAALTKVGGGYCYACDGPDSFDCSGLTTWAWGTAGIAIPRASYLQAQLPEVPLDQLQPGDLVTYYSPVSHVAIYVGDGMVVSAATESVGIVLVPVNRAGPDATGHRVPR